MSTATPGLETMRDLVRRHSARADVAESIPRLTLYRSDRPTTPVFQILRASLCIVLQGTKHAFFGRESFTYDHGSYLVSTIEMPMTSTVLEADPVRPYLGLALEVDVDAMASLIDDIGSDPVGTDAPCGVIRSAIQPDLLDALIRLLRLLDHPDEVPILRPSIEREVLFRLLQGPQGPLLRRMVNGAGLIARIGRAAEVLRTDHAASIPISVMASMTGMSISTFHDKFKKVMGMTPLAYRNRIRLQEARRLLLSGPPSIASVGFSVGYDSPSQFSREYRRAFGISPTQDFQRLAKI